MFIFKNKFFKRTFITAISIISMLLSGIFIANGVIEKGKISPCFAIFNESGHTQILYAICVILLILFFIIFIFDIVNSVLSFIARKNNKPLIVSGISLTASLIMLVITLLYSKYITITVLPVIIFIFEAIKFTYCLLAKILIKEKDLDDEIEVKSDLKALVISNIVIATASLLSTLMIFFLPLYSINGKDSGRLFDAFASTSNIAVFIGFVSFFFAYVFLIINTSQSLLYIKQDKRGFVKKTRTNLFYVLGLTIAYYLYCVVLLYVSVTNNKTEVIQSSTTLAYIPFIVASIFLILNSILNAKYSDLKKEDSFKIGNRIIVLSFLIGFALLTVLSLTSEIIKVTYFVGSSTNPSVIITLTGATILRDYAKLEGGYQALAFLIYVSIMVEAIFVISAIVLFFRRSRYFYKISFIGIMVSYMLLFGLSLFGKYYEIAQKINEESIKSLLASYNLNFNFEYTYDVESKTMIYFYASTILMIVLFAIRPFSNHYKESALDVNIKSNNATSFENTTTENKSVSKSLQEDSSIPNFDACPAFTEIDSKEKEINEDYQNRLTKKFEAPTLASITKFIVDYAKNSRLHLSYSTKDIAQFIAGLGATRLSILQGMSGTGKTSLPKIFAEAILGNVNIIEVESSWKDKNELIGYYNEFSERFTPKKFTQALYEAKFRENEITFIVLDEMNLSRIEYYFSDFLSLMENEENNRQIKLLNIKLYNIKDGYKNNYKMLNEGHTLRIPKNVWFIGTANRDESTFEISDKVYDRANTINFNKRAPKVRDYEDPIDQRFLTYDDFKSLLDNAINTIDFDSENNETIRAVEEILAPYNISFGNRIQKQIEEFVKVYVSCFDDPENHINEAVEKILLSKVVAKLEFKSVENKDELKDKFLELNLKECAEFVGKLNEDI